MIHYYLILPLLLAVATGVVISPDFTICCGFIPLGRLGLARVEGSFTIDLLNVSTCEFFSRFIDISGVAAILPMFLAHILKKVGTAAASLYILWPSLTMPLVIFTEISIRKCNVCLN